MTLLVAATASPHQTLVGPAFERFARLTERTCPARDLRAITPGDLSWEQATFAERLSPERQQRLNGIEQADRRCARSEGGLACPTTRMLGAMQQQGMLPAFASFTCSHIVPAVTVSTIHEPQASEILSQLDLTSFPNSTGPRRQSRLHTPGDYGFTKQGKGEGGWARLSEPNGDWSLSALLIEDGRASKTICFVDAGGGGATYRATETLQVKREPDGRWTAVRVGDRPGCRNDPPLPRSPDAN